MSEQEEDLLASLHVTLAVLKDLDLISPAVLLKIQRLIDDRVYKWLKGIR